MNSPHHFLAQIKVVGVGGAGGNAVNRMREADLKDVEFISINTDAQVLLSSEADVTVAIGTELTKGLGAGGNPEIGEKAAQIDVDKIQDALEGADMVFIAVGEGGGTGTGAAPVVAEVARELGSLTIAVATRPFDFEGQRRKVIANQGLRTLKDKVDAQIVIPNDRLVALAGNNISLEEAFNMADEVLMHSIKGVTDLITRPGLINTDFADVRTILGNAGSALMGVGEASGEERGTTAARRAISNPLLEDSMQSARGIILNITGGTDPALGIHEVNEAAEIVRSVASDDSNVIFGAVIDESLGEKMRVTVIAAGFAGDESAGSRAGSDLGEVLNPFTADYGSTDSLDFLGEEGGDIDLPDFLK